MKKNGKRERHATAKYDSALNFKRHGVNLNAGGDYTDEDDDGDILNEFLSDD